MRTYRCWPLIVLSLPLPVLAATVEHCPSPAAIRSAGEVYQAPTIDGQGEWIGITPITGSGPVRSFIEAIFHPAPGGASQEGHLGKCSYRLGSGGVLDLAYQPERAPRVALRETQHWQRTEGPFGLVYYRCMVRDAAQCRFEARPQTSGRQPR
jgi:hypothetical protein